MKNQYADRLTNLLDQTWPTLSATHRLDFKDVFGAVGGYVNGHIFISCGKFGVALRLPSSALDVLFQERGVKHLKYFPNGHIKKEYGVIPSRLLSDKRKFRKLLTQSISALIAEEDARRHKLRNQRSLPRMSTNSGPLSLRRNRGAPG